MRSDRTEDHQAADLGCQLEELELLRDIHRGLADVDAGRVIPHEEARARLMARYSLRHSSPRSDLSEPA
jgi:predicted transcriptional regulator